jgi:hypothetical protein
MHACSGREIIVMKTLVLDVPDFGFILGTRAALAAGIGLLVADKLSEERRRLVGGALVVLGAVTTIPAAMSVARGLRRWRQRETNAGIGYDERLIGATRYPRKGDDELS